jgi:hypothetical protein
MKFCSIDNFEMHAYKTGCLVWLHDVPTKIIDEKLHRFVINGDMYYCKICGAFELGGARVPYYSAGTPDAIVDCYNVVKGAYNEYIGDIRIFKTPKMLEHHQKWYEDVEVTWEEYDKI